MTKRDGIASDHLLTQAAATPQDELVAGLSGTPEPIPPQALLAQVLDRANLRRALKQVRQNKGAPGLDGMTVEALPDYLRHHWPEICEQLEVGCYCPQPVKRVEIEKADGKKRPLGIPTVLDRFIQHHVGQHWRERPTLRHAERRRFNLPLDAHARLQKAIDQAQ